MWRRPSKSPKAWFLLLANCEFSVRELNLQFPVGQRDPRRIDGDDGARRMGDRAGFLHVRLFRRRAGAHGLEARLADRDLEALKLDDATAVICGDIIDRFG